MPVSELGGHLCSAAMAELELTKSESDERSHAPRGLWLLAVPALLVVGGGAGFLLGRSTADDAPASASTGYTEADQQAIDALLQEGLALHVAGDLEGARTKYEQVLAVQPDNKFALFNLGLVAHTKVDYEAAVARYTAALAVDPAYQPARFNLGLVYAAQKRWSLADEAFQIVLAAQPDDARATYQLGLVRIGQGDQVAGQKLIDAAVALDPSVTSTTAG
ncbi:MAG: hypothetical protein RLZZ623_1103 [Actinomycetota bacterium]